MFFIMGITPKRESLGKGGGVCLACGKPTNLKLKKEYSVFTLFFIPIIPFGTSYFAKCPNCDSIMAVAKQKGKELEQDPRGIIYAEDLELLQNNTGPACPSCSAKIITNQSYCYRCGGKL